jgi:hypothetical protein
MFSHNIYKETGRGHSSAFHYTIPYDRLPFPSTRRRALFLFLLFLFVESSKKKRKEGAAQQILKIASEQLLRFLRVKSAQIYAHTHTQKERALTCTI